MIFISCSFDPFSKPYGELAQELFDEYGIDAYIAEHPEPGSLPDILRAKVKQSEALVALVTTQDSPWQQTEITWASEFNIPIYGIVQTGVNVRGLLPYITKYKTFDPNRSETLEEAIERIVDSIFKRIKNKNKKNIAIIVGAALALLGIYLISKKK